MDEEIKHELHRSLRRSREAVLWKVDGLPEYDVRRPLTPTGTNLLGLVKHLSIGEAWYFGDVFGRPFVPHLPWWDDDAEEGVDMWATPEESREDIVETYRAAIAHADETIAALDLDAPGSVRWWSEPDVTLHRILVHLATETARHAGHLDILREQLDGHAGLRPDNSNHDPHDEHWWAERRARIEADARRAAGRREADPPNAE